MNQVFNKSFIKSFGCHFQKWVSIFFLFIVNNPILEKSTKSLDYDEKDPLTHMPVYIHWVKLNPNLAFKNYRRVWYYIKCVMYDHFSFFGSPDSFVIVKNCVRKTNLLGNAPQFVNAIIFSSIVQLVLKIWVEGKKSS